MLIQIASIVLAAQTPVETPDLRCHGGALIFFAAGSAEIDPIGAERLESFVGYWRKHGPRGFVRIESGGDGVAAAFDRGLSRRRSEAIQAFLAKRSYPALEIVIAVGEEFGRPTDPKDSFYQQAGWVAQRIPRKEYERLYPPNLITECF